MVETKHELWLAVNGCIFDLGGQSDCNMTSSFSGETRNNSTKSMHLHERQTDDIIPFVSTESCPDTWNMEFGLVAPQRWDIARPNLLISFIYINMFITYPVSYLITRPSSHPSIYLPSIYICDIFNLRKNPRIHRLRPHVHLQTSWIV